MNCSHGAWAAGFFEGDGSVYLKKMTLEFYRPTVAAGQNNTEPLVRLQRLYGGSIQKVSTPKGKPHYRWRLNSMTDVGSFIRSIYPYVTPSVKRKKLEIALELTQVIVGEGARGPEKKSKRKQLEHQFQRLN